MKRLRVVLLLGLLAVLAYLVWSRLSVRMGGAPAELASEFRSEEEWLLHEMLLDVAEMSLAARGAARDDIRLHLTEERDIEPGRFRVRFERAAEGSIGSETVSLGDHLWDERAYRAVATMLLAGMQSSSGDAASEGLLESLLEPTDAVMADADARISRDLVAQPDSAALHEQAAMLLGVLALREAAGTFTDLRFTLGRMTGHLAMARALSVDGELRETGRLARLLVSTLGGREREALAAIDALRERAPGVPALATWLRVIEVRVTDDWRVSSAPSGSVLSLLERLERFRAMARTMDPATAIEQAGELDWDYRMPFLLRPLRFLFGGGRERIAPTDWFHIAVDNYEGPSDGMYFRGDVLERERRAAEALRERYDAGGWTLAEALNAPRERFLGPSGASVLGWGAWAGFYQRHLADHLVKGDTYYRRGLGLADEADSYASGSDRYLEDLRLHPFVRMRRTARPGVQVEDIDALPDVVAVTATHPDEVNAPNWYFAEHTTRQMALARGMPHAAEWFSPTVAQTTAFDAAQRLRILGWERSSERIADAREIAPSNRQLWSLFLGLPEREPVALDDLGSEMSRRLEYDLVALQWLRNASEGEDALSLSQRMCEIEPSSCISLGYRLIELDREDDAALAFQHAIDHAEDTVYVANNADWLVQYYHRLGRSSEAMSAARKAERTGSSGGILTMGALLEAMGRFDEAEEYFVANRGRYEQPAPLIAFYFRRARRDGLAGYEAKLEDAAKESFPQGLEPFDADALESPPVDGVLVNSNSGRLRDVGMAPGDIVVALDGWRVRSWEQYEAVRAFTRAQEMKLTLWRVNRWVDVDASVSFRRFYVDMITYEPRWSIDR